MRWRLHARSVRSRARLFQGHSGRARSSAPGRLLRFALQEIRKTKARALRAMSAVFSTALASEIWSPPHPESRNNQINSYVQDTYVQDHLRQSPTGEWMLPGAEPESDAARVHSCTLRRFHGGPEANTRDHRAGHLDFVRRRFLVDRAWHPAYTGRQPPPVPGHRPGSCGNKDEVRQCADASLAMQACNIGRKMP